MNQEIKLKPFTTVILLIRNSEIFYDGECKGYGY